MADALGISHLLRSMPDTLSVGERQRVAIARALAHRPALVLADEPTASVDPVRADQVMGLLSSLADEIGATTILSTHDPALAERHGYALVPLIAVSGTEADVVSGIAA